MGSGRPLAQDMLVHYVLYNRRAPVALYQSLCCILLHGRGGRVWVFRSSSDLIPRPLHNHDMSTRAQRRVHDSHQASSQWLSHPLGGGRGGSKAILGGWGMGPGSLKFFLAFSRVLVSWFPVACSSAPLPLPCYSLFAMLCYGPVLLGQFLL